MGYWFHPIGLIYIYILFWSEIEGNGLPQFFKEKIEHYNWIYCLEWEKKKKRKPKNNENA